MRYIDRHAPTGGPPGVRQTAAAIALALVLAACGSSSQSTDSAAQPATAAADSTSTTQSPADTPAAGDEQGAGSAEPDTSGEAEQANLFPNVEVVNLSDGSTLNLAAELGGSDLPVLLWFWAPH